jgi:copper chaperone CopZ
MRFTDRRAIWFAGAAAVASAACRSGPIEDADQNEAGDGEVRRREDHAGEAERCTRASRVRRHQHAREALRARAHDLLRTKVPMVRVLLPTIMVALAACNARPSSTSTTAASSTQTRTTSAEPAAEASSITIPVDGMSCSACAARLTRGLKDVPGVIEAEVSLQHSSARIRYMPTKTGPDQLAAAIRAMNLTPGTPSASSR